METFCPSCSKEVTPETTKCPWCGYDFGPETIKFLTSYIEEELQEEEKLQPKEF